MIIVDSFDENVNRYEAWFQHHKKAYASELMALDELLPNIGKGKGVEIGVGTGRFAAPLGIPFGVDPSTAMGKLAARRGIAVLSGVGECLPFPNNCFDLVLLVTTVCFLNDIPKALGEANRVLTPEGHILIGFIDRESFLGNVYHTRKRNDVFYEHASFLSVNELVSHLRQAGFCDFVFRQAVFKHPEKMTGIDAVRPGYGQGAFVVVRARKAVEAR